MADDVLKIFAEGRVDARSLSEFMYKPANVMVVRRLAPAINTLNYYLDLFDKTAADGATAINQAIINSGFIVVDSFDLGATITQRNEALRHTASGEFYRWGGNLPKVIPAGSTPANSGGVGNKAWVEVSLASIGSSLASNVTTGKGALVAKGAVIYVKNQAELLTIPKSSLVDGQQVQVISEGMLYTWHNTIKEFTPTNIPVSSSFPMIAEHPLAKNPVLTGDDVTDRNAIQGVADPFIVIGDDGLYHMFFEVLYSGTGVNEDIGHAWSVDGLKWTYTQIVIAEDTHAAFPQVFKHNGDWYMLPGGGQYSIYKATNFPLIWQGINDAGIESLGSDPAVFRYKGRWYSFVTKDKKVQLAVATGGLFNSTWNLHPANPVVDIGQSIDKLNLHRMAGKVIVTDRAVIAPVQSGDGAYGAATYWVMLAGLTPTTFSKSIQDSYVVQRSYDRSAWNSSGSHHVCFEDPSVGEIIAVDGLSSGSPSRYSISIYTKNPNGRKCRLKVGTVAPPTFNAGAGTGKVGRFAFPLSLNILESTDTHWAWSNTASEFTAPKTGSYLITVVLRGASNTNNAISIRLTIFNKTTNKDIDAGVYTKPEITTATNPIPTVHNLKFMTSVHLKKGEKVDLQGEVFIGTADVGAYLSIVEL